LLLARLELPDASPWFVGKRAEAVWNLYAELEEHSNEPQQHPHVRGAVRRLERLKEMGRRAPGRRAMRTNTRRTLRRELSDGSQGASRTPPPTRGSARKL
jgi:hypothetical protein